MWSSHLNAHLAYASGDQPMKKSVFYPYQLNLVLNNRAQADGRLNCPRREIESRNLESNERGS